MSRMYRPLRQWPNGDLDLSVRVEGWPVDHLWVAMPVRSFDDYARSIIDATLDHLDRFNCDDGDVDREAIIASVDAIHFNTEGPGTVPASAHGRGL